MAVASSLTISPEVLKWSSTDKQLSGLSENLVKQLSLAIENKDTTVSFNVKTDKANPKLIKFHIFHEQNASGEQQTILKEGKVLKTQTDIAVALIKQYRIESQKSSASSSDEPTSNSSPQTSTPPSSTSQAHELADNLSTEGTQDSPNAQKASEPVKTPSLERKNSNESDDNYEDVTNAIQKTDDDANVDNGAVTADGKSEALAEQSNNEETASQKSSESLAADKSTPSESSKSDTAEELSTAKSLATDKSAPQQSPKTVRSEESIADEETTKPEVTSLKGDEAQAKPVTPDTSLHPKKTNVDGVQYIIVPVNKPASEATSSTPMKPVSIVFQQEGDKIKLYNANGSAESNQAIKLPISDQFEGPFHSDEIFVTEIKAEGNYTLLFKPIENSNTASVMVKKVDESEIKNS
ncbi:hypothetical protein D5R81_01355 [Parashewanella spongiae]|uniref:Uncharacterized protein n=1 Tax=Parashewanella spongiae TaxID=342950 RepID=A0A3A6TXQ6_9GAMM|nr:hypothetical protein [Parashewanella spongiae]MCL1076806.1 hypothetical protein [Parashewanella spongiae]RJY19270.1 hypothetical protein D5R81_01355 [Parashewanella spongiae]